MAKDSSIYKYNIFTLAKDLGLPPETVRQRLRRAEIEKNVDGMYGWNNFANYNKVKAEIKAAGRAPEKRAAAKTKVAKKVAKKKVAKKAPARHVDLARGRRSDDD